MWSEMLGIGDFYYELGVQAVEACMSHRPINGGLMEINSLVTQVSNILISLSHLSLGLFYSYEMTPDLLVHILLVD